MKTQPMCGILILMLSTSALAQSAQAPTAPRPHFVPPAPLPADKIIPLDLALEAAEAALAACKAQGSNVGVEVMDTELSPKVILAADGAPSLYVDYARRKDYTVIKTGMSTREYTRSVTPPGGGRPVFQDPQMISFYGGIPIFRNGVLIGAIAASGAADQEHDEICTQAGLDKIKDRLK
jgi:uncharacterized protein GlcG (DUF336 family)